MKVKSLREKRNNLIAQQEELLKTAREEKRNISNEENEKFEKIQSDIDGLDTTLAAEERHRKNLEKQAQANQGKKEERGQEETSMDYKDVFWKHMRFQKMTNEERSILETRGTDPQTTTDAEGGYTIPEGFSNQLEVALKEYGGMLEACTILNTSTGNPIPWPTVDDTAQTGALIGEAEVDVVADMTFGQKMLNAYMYTSRIIQVSRELAQDSAFDLAGFISSACTDRIGRKVNLDFTTADGSDKPQGIVPAAGTQAAAAAAAISRDDILDLIYSIDNAYARNGRLMMNKNTVKAIRKLTVGSSDDRPIWQMGDIRTGAPSTIEGYEYIINEDMADIGANGKSVLFGDFSKYIIRLAGSPILSLSTEFAWSKRLLSYVMFQRFDGELIQANAIKALTHPAS
tara:strand:- start:84 stop:1286 length:1203 start_codon:yes stop_codon:yes gene_type:complete